MAGEAAQFVPVFERIARDALAALRGISDELLNKRLDLPESNTLFVLATHLAGAGEFWSLELTAGRKVVRDRAAEFAASGSYADLEAHFRRWIDAVRETLTPLPDAVLDEVRYGPPDGYSGVLPPGQMTARECLLHAVEHAALHLGHIQLTRQILGLAPATAD
jgi:uncharacterized damage-inducible protein DinB